MPKTSILTLRLDQKSQAFFDSMRIMHFPKERNFLKAHLTLFHQLPDTDQTIQILEGVDQSIMKTTISHIKSIGNGIAYFTDDQEINRLHQQLKVHFIQQLSAQDKQSIRPHITIQNKVSTEEAKNLLVELQASFQPFEVRFEGLDLWYYMDGPWRHSRYFPFTMQNR